MKDKVQIHVADSSSDKKKKRSRRDDDDEKEQEERMIDDASSEDSDKRRRSSSSKKKESRHSKSSRSNEEETAATAKKKKHEKKGKKKGSDDEEQQEEDDDSNKADEEPESNFGEFPLSEKRIKFLLAADYKTLFPIQAATFPHIFSGEDLIGKARTGTGKTVAFLLPVIERLEKEGFKRERGHKILVVTPTRELAKQIGTEVSKIAPDWSHCCIYGGSDYAPQVKALRAGVDVVVGCPGRLNDHIEKGTLKFSSLRCVILDEADKMLDMGFAEPTEQILDSVKIHLAAASRTQESLQGLLFSATIPPWVSTMVKKFLKPGHKTIDMVGNSRDQTSTGVTHMAISCGWAQRPAVLADLIRCYAGFRGRTIVFTDTKKEANELALDSSIQADCGVLHGDIAQNQREITLESFRDGKIRCMIATDVAARGIDIPEVDLVVLCHPPKDPDTYVHRSGRTGRAGRKGICIVMYQLKEKSLLDYIERRAGLKFQKIGPPQPADVVKAAASDAARATAAVDSKALEYFRESAETLVEERGAIDAVAACLAVLAGYEKPPMSRSLLSSEEGQTTIIFRLAGEGEPIRTNSFVWGQLRRWLPEKVSAAVKGVKLLVDGTGAAFDIADEFVSTCINCKAGAHFKFEVATQLPELQGVPAANGRGNNYGGGNSYGGGNNNSYGNRSQNSTPRGGRGGATFSSGTPVQGDCRVFVGGLPPGEVEELDEELRASLGAHGTISDIYIPRDFENGRAKGIAFVTFTSPNEALTAVNRGGNAKGRALRIALAGARPSK